jgi:hypothetical protein
MLSKLPQYLHKYLSNISNLYRIWEPRLVMARVWNTSTLILHSHLNPYLNYARHDSSNCAKIACGVNNAA